MRIRFQSFLKTLLAAGFLLGATQTYSASNSMAQLGKKIFFDANLLDPAGQSCASCHQPEAG
jgi:cytochrome c peroxidase